MIEEIRVRAGQKLEVCENGQVGYLEKEISRENIYDILQRLTDYSIFAYENQMKNGFFTIEGGHRIGVVGHVSRDTGYLSDICGLNIRFANECIDCAKELLPFLKEEGDYLNTIFVSSPGVGKTTYLRDCTRLISQEGWKVGVVDERSELGAFCKGYWNKNLGPRTDLLDNCVKSEGMLHLLRTMSPQIIVVDELAGKEDYMALEEIFYGGVTLIGSVHGKSLEEVTQKPYLKDFIKRNLIHRIVLLTKMHSEREVRIYDAKDSRLLFDSTWNGRNCLCEGQKQQGTFVKESQDAQRLLSFILHL